MPKILAYSDLHIRPKRIDDCVTVLKAIPKIYKAYNCDLVVNGGDTFDTRGIIETHCLKAIYDEYKAWSVLGIKQITLVGNHDQEDRDGEIHPMSIFSFQDWQTVDEPTEIHGIWFFPYMKSEKIDAFFRENDVPRYEFVGLKKQLEREASGYKSKFQDKTAFVHWGFTGAYMNDWRKDPSGVSSLYVEPFKKVYSGHYHYRASLEGNEKIQYIGSPLQQSFAEMGQDKGVLIIDTDKNEFEFVEIKGTSKHHKLEVSWSEKGRRVVRGNKKDIKEKDFVEYVVSGDAERVGNLKRETLSKIVPCKSLKITRQVKEKSHSRLNITSKEVYDIDSLMDKYVSFVETDLNKKNLLLKGKEIVNANL